jgi:hypothetical protein
MGHNAPQSIYFWNKILVFKNQGGHPNQKMVKNASDEFDGTKQLALALALSKVRTLKCRITHSVFSSAPMYHPTQLQPTGSDQIPLM